MEGRNECLVPAAFEKKAAQEQRFSIKKILRFWRELNPNGIIALVRFHLGPSFLFPGRGGGGHLRYTVVRPQSPSDFGEILLEGHAQNCRGVLSPS